MAETSWDDATQPGGDFLKGESLPSTGQRAVLCSITIEEMAKFDFTTNEPTDKMETCFIGHFEKTDTRVNFNKTARIYLKDECGITQETLGNFKPFEVVLYPVKYTRGIAVAVRLPDNAPEPQDEVPF